jgi:elongation factor G
MHAQQREDLEEVGVGEIAAAVGARDTNTGDTLCDEDEPIILETISFPEPVISMAIEPKTRVDQDRLMDALSKISSEDPTFKIGQDDEVGQTIISGMGELHLEIIVDRMMREFKVGANVGKPKVAFRETITAPARAEERLVRQTGGHGQYAHVVLDVEPLERNAGFEFEDSIRGGSIPREYIPAVNRGIEDAMSAGPIGGYPVIDLKASLVDGSFHDVDSSEMAFRIAGSMAAKSALRKARPVLLEPIMRMEAVLPGEFLGDVLGDLGRRRANIRGIEGRGDIQVVRALLPLSESFGYAGTLRSLTQGRASHSMEFEHYEEVPSAVAAAQTG